MDKTFFHSNHLFSENQTSQLTLEMDSNEKKIQSIGICHRLFCFIMKTLAAQALKPVTLGPSVPTNPRQPPIHAAMDSRSCGLVERDEDSESFASIDVEDVACPLLDAVADYEDQEKVTVEIMGECKSKAPRKMVSIKDEPEIIHLGAKRRKTMAERQISSVDRDKEKEMRPLRSILKVGSNLCETSSVNVKPIRKSTMDK